MKRFIIFMFTTFVFVLGAADAGSIIIQNKYGYALNLLITKKEKYHQEREEYSLAADQEQKFSFKNIQEIAFASGAYKVYSDINIADEDYEHRYVVIFRKDDRQGHALRESLYISITAPYISMTQGYGDWQIESRWVDPQQEEAEILGGWEELPSPSDPTQDLDTLKELLAVLNTPPYKGNRELQKGFLKRFSISDQKKQFILDMLEQRES